MWDLDSIGARRCGTCGLRPHVGYRYMLEDIPARAKSTLPLVGAAFDRPNQRERMGSSPAHVFVDSAHQTPPDLTQAGSPSGQGQRQ
jgi:hypothetical protein